MTFALITPTTFGVLFWTAMTRYCRPKTLWSFFEKLTSPEIVPRS